MHRSRQVEISMLKGKCNMHSAEFHTGFLVGGGELFWNSKIDIKHTFLGGVWGEPKFLD